MDSSVAMTESGDDSRRARSVSFTWLVLCSGVLTFLATLLVCELARIDELVLARSSDTTYLSLIFNHVSQWKSVSDFSLSNSPYLFPDLLIESVLRWVSGSQYFAYVGYTATCMSLIFTFIMPWMNRHRTLRGGSRAVCLILGTVLLQLTIAGFLISLHWPVNKMVSFVDAAFMPAFHCGAAVAGLGFLSLLRRIHLEASSGYLLGCIGLLILGALSVGSDTLLIPWFIIPAACAIIGTSRFGESNGRVACSLAACFLACVLGIFMNHWVRSMTLPLAAGVHFGLDSGQILTQWERLQTHYTNVLKINPIQLGLTLSALVLALRNMVSRDRQKRFIAIVYVASISLSHLALLVVPLVITARCLVGSEVLSMLVLLTVADEWLEDRVLGRPTFTQATSLRSSYLWVGCATVLFSIGLVRLSMWSPTGHYADSRDDFLRMVAWLHERELTHGVAHMSDAKRIMFATESEIFAVPLQGYEPACPAAPLTTPDKRAPQFIATKHYGEKDAASTRLDLDFLERYLGKPSKRADFGQYSVIDFRGNDLFKRLFEPKLLELPGDEIEIDPLQMVWPNSTLGKLDAEKRVLSVQGNANDRNHLGVVYHLWLNDGRYRLDMEKSHRSGEISIELYTIASANGELAYAAKFSPSESEIEFDYDGPNWKATRVALQLFSAGDLEASIDRIRIRKIQ